MIGLAVLGLIHRIEQRIPSAVYHTLALGVVPDKREDVRTAVLAHCRKVGMRAQVIGWEWRKEGELVTLRFRIRHRGTVDLSEIGEVISSLSGVRRIEISG